VRLVPLLLLLLAGCDKRPDQWDAFVYRDGDDLTRHVELRGFKTFEQCQQASINLLRSYPEPDEGDYECGYKCEFDPDLTLNVCKETRK
jgi:hypothetical protein